MKRIFSCLLAVMLAFSACITAFANDDVKENIVIELTEEDLADNAADVIDSMLSIPVRDESVSSVTVNVPSGTYVLSHGLHVYRNVTLNLENDTEFIRGFDDGSLLRTGKYYDVNSAYEGYSNIEVNGGTWNNNYKQKSCGMRLMHCENIVLKNFTVKNIYDSHHIEIGAARNITIDNLTLTGYKRSENTSGEAIQIDPVHSEKHFKSTTYLDDTPCKNITVKNCTFKNLFSGVGSRSGVIGSYFYNINIINNTFDNITDKAIETFNYVNCNIKNNTINNANIGVFVELYPYKNLTSKLYMPYKNASSAKIVTNTKTVISGNSITIKKKSSYAQSCAVAVFGGILSKANAKKTGLKSGNYLAKNVNITNNKININSASSCGLDLHYVYSSYVSGNTIMSSSKTSKTLNGISLYNSKSNTIRWNKITGKVSNGILLSTNSTSNNLYSNNVKKAQHFGLYVNKTSYGTVQPSNSFSGNGKGTLYVKDKVVYVPKINKKIKVTRKNGKNKVKWKAVKKVNGYIIYRASSKNGEYKQYKKVSSKKKSFTEKSKKKYYYKVAPYRTYNKTTVLGKKVSA